MQTAALPEAAIPRAVLADRPDAPRVLPCAFPPDLPWLGLLLPLTQPKAPVRQHRRLAANAYGNTAARTPASGSVPSRLRAPVPAQQRSSTRTRSHAGWGRRRTPSEIR